MEPRANHDLLAEPCAAAAGCLQPRERVEHALTEHVEPTADVKAGDTRRTRVAIVDEVAVPDRQADIICPRRGDVRGRVGCLVDYLAMQDAAVEQSVVEEVARREARRDAAQRRDGARCREIVHDPTVAQPQHRSVPVGPGPLRPRLIIEGFEEGLAVLLVSTVDVISAVQVYRVADVLDDEVVIRVGRPVRRGVSRDCTPRALSADDEHRPPRVVGALQVDVGRERVAVMSAKVDAKRGMHRGILAGRREKIPAGRRVTSRVGRSQREYRRRCDRAGKAADALQRRPF